MTLAADDALIAICSASRRACRRSFAVPRRPVSCSTISGTDHLVSGKVYVTRLRLINTENMNAGDLIRI